MKRSILIAISLIVLLEGSSLLAFFHPHTEVYSLVLFAIIAALLTYRKLEYGLFLICGELIISSFGRMLSHETLSLRMLLFFIVLLVWSIKHVPTSTSGRKELAKRFHRSVISSPLFILLIILAIAFQHGVFAGRDFMTIFKDANGYAFLLLFIPVTTMKFSPHVLPQLIRFSSIALSWLIIKSLIIFTYFTHVTQPFFDSWFYVWLRDMRVAEITPYGDGLVRVFLQSHIFLALAFLILMTLPKRYWPKHFAKLLIGVTSVILMSLSRSMWLGVGCAVVILLGWLIYRKKFSLVKRVTVIGVTSVLLGFVVLHALYILPFGVSEDRAPLHTLFAQRVQAIDSEVAAASRWEQLPILWNAVKEKPILGHGFGKSLEIKNPHDASIVEDRVAFEWGWFDLWIKAGVLGVLAYIWLLYNILKKIYRLQLPKGHCQIKRGLLCAIIALIIINIFTPYLNHPLGMSVLAMFFLVSSLLYNHLQNPDSKLS